jgi:hypothetical protein
MRYPHGVTAISPVLEGFRASLRRPAISFAEIIWHWSVGAAALVLFCFGFYEYLSTLPVNSAEALFLQTKQPILVVRALAHIFSGSWNRAVAAGLLAALALALLWMIAASFGRMATVGSLLDYFRRQRTLADPEWNEVQNAGAIFRSLFRLNFLRFVITVAAICGVVGGAILAGFASPDSEPNPGFAFLVFFFIASFVALAWWMLNWFLSLAAVLQVRDGEDALGAISAAVAFCRDRASEVFSVSFWTALAHMAACVVATSIAVMPLALLGTIPWRIIAITVLVITILYFAVADWIHIVRIAGYVCISEMRDPKAWPRTQELGPIPPGRMSGSTPIAGTETAVDRNELILSDLPSLAPEA